MVMASFSMREDYWDNFELSNEDVEFLYNFLLEKETPLLTEELVSSLVVERLRQEKEAIEHQRTSGGDLYQPKGAYTEGQTLVFPAMSWRPGKVLAVRPGNNPDLGDFSVIQVQFAENEKREFAAGLAGHVLNEPPKIAADEASFDPQAVLNDYGDELAEKLEEELGTNSGFVRIAGRWFPRALLVDINAGHLNLAEAVLDMAGGGPVSTQGLIDAIGLPSGDNANLVEFSMDLALQEDPRFDEVGPAGDVLWFLNRLEPPEVLEPPLYLRYPGLEHDRGLLTKDMLALERELDDELSPLQARPVAPGEEAQIHLIFPHWRAGTLPLSARVRALFPTAYEAPRIRFQLVDGDSGESFPGWVVREKRYVYGLKDWFAARNLMPGSLVKVRRGAKPGEVIVRAENRRSTREWVRTCLVGSDGGLVFAMLKQSVSAAFDERLVIAVPDAEAIDQIWVRQEKQRPPFERTIVNTVRELAKLNPQSHVHASELYAAINVIRRCPPGPILALLSSRPWFVHVGDLHFRFNDSEQS